MQSRQAQLMRASELYYERGLSQQKIADILGVSRPTVSRLLEEARKSGVVEIVVHAPLKQNYELSERLRRELGLKDAVVIQGEASPDRSPALRRCAQAAGQLFLSLLESGMTVGLSWGRVLRQFCDTLPQQKHTFNVNVVQTIGCLGTGNPHLDGLELTLALAKKLNGTFYNVYAPVYVDSALVQSYLLREPSVELAIRQAGQADIILTGIGSGLMLTCGGSGGRHTGPPAGQERSGTGQSRPLCGGRVAGGAASGPVAHRHQRRSGPRRGDTGQCAQRLRQPAGGGRAAGTGGAETEQFHRPMNKCKAKAHQILRPN